MTGAFKFNYKGATLDQAFQQPNGDYVGTAVIGNVQRRLAARDADALRVQFVQECDAYLATLGPKATEVTATVARSVDVTALLAFLEKEATASGEPTGALAAAERRIERLLAQARRAHDACADPSRPRQHVGELLAHLLEL